ncbi:uncharacterized protein DUF1772 [Mycobacterium sp. BK558]|nr:uncharacterized protein DUF1772 [Mycobacterium sp. BK558]
MTLELARWAAAIAVLGTAVVYGTDVFCAMVVRPALAAVSDDALVEVMGGIHRYGDRRMPVPGVLGIVAAGISAAVAAVSAHWAQAVAAGVAFALLLGWLGIYARVSAPINSQLTAASTALTSLPQARALQDKWDSVIDLRAAVQGLAVAALCVALAV